MYLPQPTSLGLTSRGVPVDNQAIAIALAGGKEELARGLHKFLSPVSSLRAAAGFLKQVLCRFARGLGMFESPRCCRRRIGVLPPP